MSIVNRDGVNIEVAFSSATKRRLNEIAAANEAMPVKTLNDIPISLKSEISGEHSKKEETPLENHEEVVCSNEEISFDNEKYSGRGSLKIRSGIRDFFRKAAKIVFRLLLPVIRPIAFRARIYLTSSLRQEIAIIQQETLATRDSLRQELVDARAFIAHEISRDTGGTLQEIHAARASVVQEISRGTGEMLQEIQAARESLRQDVATAHAVALEEIRRTSSVVIKEVLTANESLKCEVFNSLVSLDRKLGEVLMSKNRHVEK